MIQINLLPTLGGKSAKDDKQFLLVYAVCIFLTLATVTYLWISQSGQINTANNRLGALNRQVQHYAKYDRMLKDLKSRLALIKRKTEVVKTLEKDRDLTVRAMALLSAEMPVGKMWFENLKQNAGTMTLKGVALSNEAIAEFMRNLESSPYVEKGSVSLQHSRQVAIQNRKLREFQMSYQFHPYSSLPRPIGPAAHQQQG